MSNAVVTPLFPTGSRVRAWCVSSLSRRQTSTSIAFNFVGQAQCDQFNFIDGYNLRLSGIFNPSTDRIYFQFVTPLSDASYRVFIQPRMNPTNESTVDIFSSTLEQFRMCHVLNTPAFPKTRNGFWIRMGCMNLTTWINTAKLIRPDVVENRQSTTANASRKTLALSLVVL
jgi:hypothetical protein